MTRKKALGVPAGLGDAGASLWSEIAGKYVLRADEKRTLEAACRAADRIVAMEAERDGEVMTTGSMGQPIVHPLIAEVRATEAQMAGMLAKLKLPDDDAGQAPVSQQRAAAQSRWASAHGASA